MSYFWFKSPVFSLSTRRSSVLDAEVLLAAGGGGSSRTGIANTISVIGLQPPPSSSAGAAAPVPQRLHDVDTDDMLVLHVSVSPDAQFAAAVAGGGSLLLYRIRRGTEPSITLVHTIRVCRGDASAQGNVPPAGMEGSSNAGGLSCAAWSIDGTHLAVGSDDGVISVWRVAEAAAAAGASPSKAPVDDDGGKKKKKKSAPIQVLDGGLVDGAAASALRLISPAPAHPVLLLRGHTGSVEALSFGPGDELCSASTDGTVRVWETRLGGGMRQTAAEASEVRVHVLPCIGGAAVGDRFAPIPRRGSKLPSAGPWAPRTIAWELSSGELAPRLLVLESSQKGAAVVCEWMPVFEGGPGIPPACAGPRWGKNTAISTLQTCQAERQDGGSSGTHKGPLAATPPAAAPPTPPHSNGLPAPDGPAEEGAPPRAPSPPADPAAPTSARVVLGWRCARWQLAHTAPCSTLALVAGSPLFPAALLALGTSDGSLLLLDGASFSPVRSAATGTNRRGLREGLHGFPITSIAHLPQHHALATGAADSQIVVLPLPRKPRPLSVVRLLLLLLWGLVWLLAAVAGAALLAGLVDAAGGVSLPLLIRFVAEHPAGAVGALREASTLGLARATGAASATQQLVLARGGVLGSLLAGSSGRLPGWFRA